MRPDTGDAAVDAVLHVAHLIRTRTDTELRRTGLSLSGYKVLRALDGADRPMHEISHLLHVAPRTVTDLVDGLTAQGLVERRAHPTDRRSTLLHLTSSGVQRLAQARDDAERTGREVLGPLSAAERVELLRLLVAVRDASGERAR